MTEPPSAHPDLGAPDPDTLLDRVRAGDQDAWNEIVERYSPLVWKVARSYRLSDADAADVGQATWLLLLEHIDSITNPATLAGWLATTTRRQALRVLRASARTTVEATIEPAESDSGDTEDTEDPAVRYERQERHQLLWQAFVQLPERCQRLLRMTLTQGTSSYADMSTALGMPAGSIGPTRARCLGRLRSLLGVVSTPQERRPDLTDMSDAELVATLRASHEISDPVTSEVLEASRRLPDSLPGPNTSA
jgi:RNA polymerase sigma factor (sigma-70 family)